MTQIELGEILNSIKEENSLNNEVINKTVSDINEQLRSILKDETMIESIHKTVDDLKFELFENNQILTQSFENLRGAFQSLDEKQDLFTKNSDMKIMFNVFNENVENFGEEINEQKKLILKLDENLAEFRNDPSKKDEILQHISVAKEGIDEVNRGLQSSIMEVNSNLRGISKQLLTMDVTEQNDIIKRELENIYLAVNALLSSMEMLDQQNEEFSKSILEKFDFTELSDSINNSFGSISEKLDAIQNKPQPEDRSEDILAGISANREELQKFNSNVSNGLTEYLASIKEVLANSVSEFKEHNANLIANSDERILEKFNDFSNISNEISRIEEFMATNNEKLQFADVYGKIEGALNSISEKLENIQNAPQIVDKSDAILAEISANREELQKFNSNVSDGLTEYLASIKEILNNSMLEFKENNVKFLTDSDEKILEKFKNLGNISLDIAKIENFIAENHEKLEFVDIYNKIENALDSISDQLAIINAKEQPEDKSSDIIAEIELNRNELKKFNESISAGLSEYLVSVKDALQGSVEEFKQNNSQVPYDTNESFQNKLQQFESLKDEIAKLENVISENGEKSVALFEQKIKDLNDIVVDFKENLSIIHGENEQNSFENFERLNNLLSHSSDAYNSKFDGLSEKLDRGIDVIEKFVEANDISIDGSVAEIENIKNEISNVLQNLDKLQELNKADINEIGEKVEGNFVEFKENLVNFCANFETLKFTLEQANIENRDLLTSMVNEVTDKVRSLLAGINNDETIQAIRNNDVQLEIIKGKFNELNTIFTTVSAQNVEKILGLIKTTSDKIDVVGADLATEMEEHFETIKDYFETSKQGNNQISAEFTALAERFANVEAEISKNSEYFKNAILEQNQNLENYIAAIREIQKEDNGNSEEFGMLAEKILTIETAMHNVGDSFGEDLMVMQNRISDYVKSVDNVSKVTDEKLDSSMNELLSIKSELTNVMNEISGTDEKISASVDGISTSLVEKLDDLLLNISDLKQNVDSNITSKLQQNIELIDEKITVLQDLVNDNNLRSFDKLSEATQDFNNHLEDLKQEIGLVSTDVSEVVSAKLAIFTESIEPIKESIDNFVNTDFDKMVADIKSQVELSFLNFSSVVEENLTENHDNYIHIEEAYNSLVENFENIGSVISNLNQNQISDMLEAISSFDKKLAEAVERTSNIMESWKESLGNLEKSFEQKASENKEEIKSSLSELLNKDEFETRLSAMDLEFVNLGTELQEIKQNSSDNLAKTTEDLFNLQTSVNEAEKNLEKNFDKVANQEQAERIETLMKSLHEKMDIIAMSGDDENLEESIQALHDKIDLIATIKNGEGMEENLQALNDKVDVIVTMDNSDSIEEMIQVLNDKIDVLAMSDSETHIEELVQELHDKVDIIAASDDEELYNEIQDIKNLINEQRKKFEGIGYNAQSEDVDKKLEKLSSYLSAIDFEKNASDIKDSLMNAILAVADQITFVEETEEIKGFVEERTDEINKNLLDVKKQLNNIASSSEAWDYSYTMQDIESDIAKLRLILNDMSSSTSKDDISEISQNMHKIAASVNGLHSSLTEEQILGLKSDIEKINSDVISLSSRTNKLLLTSDESYKALTDGLNDFSKLTNQLENRIAILDKNSASEVVEKQLDKLNTSISSISNNSEIVREVMTYLGEWIDDASENFNKISANVEAIPNIQAEVEALKSVVGESSIINSLEKKFQEQQDRIDGLERKLDKVLSTLENSKIDSIDDKINRLAKGIEKLASYVDED